MKKLLLVALAAVGMAACVQNEELAVNKNYAIAFDQFVNRATPNDPSLTVGTLDRFQVWGYMEENTGIVFTGDEVWNTGSGWTYTNTQYWAPNKDYYFEAVAPVANKHWAVAAKATNADITALSFENVAGTEDLLYAYQAVPARSADVLAAGVDAVQLQFTHLLSKIQFSFKNAFPGDNVTVKVSEVTMAVPSKATVALNVDNSTYTVEKVWSGHEGSLNLVFGAATDDLLVGATEYTPAENILLTIPTAASHVYTVSFRVQVLQGDKEAMNEVLTSVISGKELLVGKAYNFKALIGPEALEMQPIEFNVEQVIDWIPDGGADMPLPAPVVVNSADGLDAALNAGEDYILLSEDIAYSSSYTLSKNVTIDLNGNTLTVEPTKMLNIKSNVTIENGSVAGIIYSQSGDVTISNVKFTGPVSRAGSTEGQLQIKGGNVLVKDCTFSNTSYTGTKPRCVTIEGRSAGSIKFENCKFNSTNLERLYANQIKGTATLEFLNCTFSIAPVFAMTSGGLYSNILFNGCTSSLGISYEMYDRASTTGLTAEETAIVEGIFQNNKISSAKLYYTDTTITMRK